MDIGQNLNVDGSVTASGKLRGGGQAESEGDAVLLNSAGKVPADKVETTVSGSVSGSDLVVNVNGVASNPIGLPGGGATFVVETPSFNRLKEIINTHPENTLVLVQGSAGDNIADMRFGYIGVIKDKKLYGAGCINDDANSDPKGSHIPYIDDIGVRFYKSYYETNNLPSVSVSLLVTISFQ